jgi:hypothetical protein
LVCLLLIIFGQVYKSLSSSLWSFLQIPVTSPHFGPDIRLSVLSREKKAYEDN